MELHSAKKKRPLPKQKGETFFIIWNNLKFVALYDNDEGTFHIVIPFERDGAYIKTKEIPPEYTSDVFWYDN